MSSRKGMRLTIEDRNPVGLSGVDATKNAPDPDHNDGETSIKAAERCGLVDQLMLPDWHQVIQLTEDERELVSSSISVVLQLRYRHLYHWGIAPH